MSQELTKPVESFVEMLKSILPEGFLKTLSGTSYITSIDDTTPAGRREVFACLAEKGENYRDYINVPIRITNFLMQPAEWTDASTGERIQSLITVLCLDSGKKITTHSQGIAKFLLLITDMWRQPPWEPPLAATIVQQPLKGEKSWAILKCNEVDIPTAPPPQQSRSKGTKGTGIS